MLVGGRDQLTCYYKVIQLVALSVKVFFHSRDVGIGDVLLAEELGISGQYPVLASIHQAYVIVRPSGSTYNLGNRRRG
jgi:hypothetical protein